MSTKPVDTSLHTSDTSHIDDCNVDISKCKSLNNIIDALNSYNKSKEEELKDWLKEKNLWDKSLHNQLITDNIYCIDQINILSQEELDSILRKARINMKKHIKKPKIKNTYDLLLVTFEKECIKLKKNEFKTGINYNKYIIKK